MGLFQVIQVAFPVVLGRVAEEEPDTAGSL
jgi:hypothetical protein